MVMQNLPGISKTPPEKILKDIRRKPAVVQQPETYQRLQKGGALIVNAVRPTLGPLPRLVALERLDRSQPPEFLDDGATIARRIIQILPRSADVGAMMVRSAMWEMHQEVGDGSTTMAVMYQAIVEEGIRSIVHFGYNPLLLRAGLEKGLRRVKCALAEQVSPLVGQENTARLAQGMCQDNHELAQMLAEILDIVSAEGMVFIEGWNRRGLDREYIEGTYWKFSGWFSRHFVNEPEAGRTTFEDAALLITDLALNDPNEMIPVLEKCAKAGIKRLVILASEVSDAVIGLLVSNNRAKSIETVAVRTPGIIESGRSGIMDDLAVLTGGRAFFKATKSGLSDFQINDLGTARRVWATESLFGLYGGKGDPRLMRQQIALLRSMIQAVDDPHEKEKLQERLGRLSGGTAILRLGGIHETEREALKAVAERALQGLRSAIRSGVVPGGGAALLSCQAALTEPGDFPEEDSVAFRILARALEEPMRTIAANAGRQADVIVEKVHGMPFGYGLDARTGQIVDMVQMGIVDAFQVIDKAVEVAVSGAAMLLTTDIIVHTSIPLESVEP